MQYQTEEIFLQGKKVEKENKQLVDFDPWDEDECD